MGTRSLTFVYDDNDKPIIKLYRQFDGYPRGHGLELAEFLNGREIINGIGSGDYERRVANGMGCLAAQLVAHFKDGVGGFYLYNVEPADHWQEYEYHVYKDRIKVLSTYNREEPFEGPWDELEAFCHNTD